MTQQMIFVHRIALGGPIAFRGFWPNMTFHDHGTLNYTGTEDLADAHIRV